MTEWRFDEALRYLPFLVQGIKLTFLITLVSTSIGAAIGLLMAIARSSRFKLASAIAGFYVDVMRAIPVLVLLVWVFFVMPILIGYSLTPFASGVVALSLYASAYLAEIFRAGIRSLERNQWQAGLALGMTFWQMMRRVILPQAIVRMLPPLGSMFVSLFKDSAVVSAIGVYDLMRQGLTLSLSLIRPMEVMTITAVLYFILTYPQTIWVNYLHRRFSAH